MRLGRLVVLVLFVSGCTNPVPLTAEVQTAATQSVAVDWAKERLKPTEFPGSRR